MKGSRIVAVALVAAAVAWIGSGVVGKDDRKAAEAAKTSAAKAVKPPLFRVAVMPVKVEPHARRIVLSGRTEADKRALANARTAGLILDLRVRRGSVVKTGDIIAVLSDDAREAMVDQAKAKLEQRQIELRAKLKLIESGNFAAINKPQLEAELKGAEAGLAQAEAEREKALVRAPIAGVVNDVPVEIGQALLAGANVAEIIALDPMLAVVELAERQLAGVKVGDKAEVKLVTGGAGKGNVRFISPKASAQTRTYRIEVTLPNEAGSIPDGVTCEVILKLTPTAAAQAPRSALTFSAEGRLGVRVVDGEGKVSFLPVGIVEDGPDSIWLSGIPNETRVIVRGQDFVKEGEIVEPVPATAAAQS